MKRSRKILFSFAAVLLGFALAFAITEVYFRTIYGSEQYNRMLYGTIYANKVKENVPNFKIFEGGLYWDNNPYFVTGDKRGRKIMIDSTFRRFPVSALRESFRVVTLGDSISVVVRKDKNSPEGIENYSYFLEKRLDKYPPLGKRAIVVNMGGGSYGPYQEMRAMDRKGRRFKPHLVIQEFSTNDLGGFVLTKKHPYYTTRDDAYVINVGDTDRPVVQSLPLPRAVNTFLTRPLVLFQFLNVRSDSLVQKLLRIPGTRYYETTKKDAFRWLDGIRRICDKNHANYLIVMFPSGERPYNELRLNEHPFEVVQEYSRSRRMHCLNLVGPLRKYSIHDLALDDPGHLTRKGHEVVAGIIFDYLTKHPELLRSQAEFTEVDFSQNGK
jgi:lysophospholipase L1-like esterase